MIDVASVPSRRTRAFAFASALYASLLLAPNLGAVETATDAAGSEPPPAPQSRLRLHAAWPEGITYEIRKTSPALRGTGFSYFDDVYVLGRAGARLDIDGAVFAAERSLSGFDDGVEVRRARFYLLGDFRLGFPLAYKFEFSVEDRRFFLNDFYVRWKPKRWVDAVDAGYLTPPMGLENIVSSRSLALMEVATPVQALAPGYRSGIAAAGHLDSCRTAWKAGLFSAGQEQISGDASKTSAQFVGRVAWAPWRPSDDTGAFAHLGLSVSYVFSGDNTIRYRARPESFIAPFVVDTGDTAAGNAFQSGLEAAWVDGRFAVLSETLQSSVVADNGNNRHFYGTYGLLSWMLTGEHYPYDDRTGMIERVQPSRPFTFAGDGWGALQVSQRVSWLDLDDDGVRGGRMLSATSGITWHLNVVCRLFANYVFAHVTDGPQRGNVSIFQARIEIGI